ncbi:MAG: rhomboid family intramembrane serine protease [Acidobacteriota bacterium]
MNESLKRLLESLGISWVWWQWRWRNFKGRVAYAFCADSNVARRLRTTQKVCRCGALAAGDQRKCEVCGRSLPSSFAWFLYRVFGLVMPGMAVTTGVLSGLIFLGFGATILQGGWLSLLAPPPELLVRMGALYSPAVFAGEWWRLLTCMFLHIGIIHLGFNTMALLSVSTFLEEEIGSSRYFCVFLLTGLGGSLATLFLRPYPVVVAGASGALFGLIGFSIAYFHRLKSARGRDVKAFMVRWAIYGFVFGLLVGADNLAHLGGLATGMILGALVEQREEIRRRREGVWRVATVALAGLLAIACAMALRSALI